MAHAALPIPASGVRCRVCGCDDVHTDEVVDGEVLCLAECPRCDHRWTTRAPRVRSIAARVAQPAPQEVASAA